MDQLRLHLNGTYTMAEGSFESFDMNLPAETVAHGDYDYSAIRTYSDLDQSYYEIDVGGSYDLSSHVGLFANLNYTDFSDDEIWVYGDQTGDWYDATIGAVFRL